MRLEGLKARIIDREDMHKHLSNTNTTGLGLHGGKMQLVDATSVS